MAKCGVCRGYKQMPGIGGIWRECWGCDGRGYVPGVVGEVSGGVVSEVVPGLKDSSQGSEVAIAAANNEVAGVEALPQATPSCEVLGGEDGAVGDVVSAADVIGAADLFMGYSVEFIEGLLAEGKYPIQEWKERYKGVPGLVDLGVRERASLREVYALSKPAAPRKVDLLASQDRVAASDPEYVKSQRRKAKE